MLGRFFAPVLLVRGRDVWVEGQAGLECLFARADPLALRGSAPAAGGEDLPPAVVPALHGDDGGEPRVVEHVRRLLADLAVEVGDEELRTLGKALRFHRGDELCIREGSRRERHVGGALRGLGEVLAVVRLERADIEHLVPVAVEHDLALVHGDHRRARGGRHGAVSAARSGSYATAAKAVEPWRGGREEGGGGDRAHVLGRRLESSEG